MLEDDLKGRRFHQVVNSSGRSRTAVDGRTLAAREAEIPPVSCEIWSFRECRQSRYKGAFLITKLNDFLFGSAKNLLADPGT